MKTILKKGILLKFYIACMCALLGSYGTILPMQKELSFEELSFSEKTCRINQDNAQLLYDEQKVIELGKKLIKAQSKFDSTIQKLTGIAEQTSRYSNSSLTTSNNIPVFKFDLPFSTPEGFATVMIFLNELKSTDALPESYRDDVDTLLKDANPEVQRVGEILLNKIEGPIYEKLHQAEEKKRVDAYENLEKYIMDICQRHEQYPYTDKVYKSMLKKTPSLQHIIQAQQKKLKEFVQTKDNIIRSKMIDTYLDQLKTCISNDNETERQAKYEKALENLKTSARQALREGSKSSLVYLKTQQDPSRTFPSRLLEETSSNITPEQPETDNSAAQKPNKKKKQNLKKKKARQLAKEKAKNKVKHTSSCNTNADNESKTQDIFNMSDADEYIQEVQTIGAIPCSTTEEEKSSDKSELATSCTQDYVISQETNKLFTTIYDQLNHMKAAAYSFANKGYKVTIGKFSYAPNVEQWYTNPKQALIDQGYTDISNAKHKYLRENPEKVITIHRPSKKLQELIVEKGMQTTVCDTHGGQALCIKMFGHVELDNSGNKTTCMYRWLINPRTKVCFHYNIEFPENIIEEIFSHGCSAFDNPEFINIVFPKYKS